MNPLGSSQSMYLNGLRSGKNLLSATNYVQSNKSNTHIKSSKKV